MIAIGQFVFYIPFFIMLSILFYYIKWTKKKFSVLLASLPAVYFTYQIFSFRHLGNNICISDTHHRIDACSSFSNHLDLFFIYDLSN